MKNLGKIFLSLVAAAFIFSSPVLAADNMLNNLKPVKPSLTDTVKEKAAGMVEEGKDKVDATADKLEKALDAKKENAADKVKQEVMEVKEESVTVGTPKGEAQATEITVSPEAPAANK